MSRGVATFAGLLLIVAVTPTVGAAQGTPGSRVVFSVDTVRTPLEPSGSPTDQGPQAQTRGDRYQIPVKPGALVEVAVGSLDFDTTLRVEVPNGPTLTNDDYGSSTDSRLLVAVPADATSIVVIVGAFRAEGGGHYSLSVTERGQSTASTVTGKITRRSPRTIKGERYDVRSVSVGTGKDLMFRVSSQEFVPSLVAITPSGRRLFDRGDDVVPTMEIPVAEAGEWTLYVLSASGEGLGSYDLESLQTSTNQGVQRLDGELARGDSVSLRGEYYDRFVLEAGVGEDWSVRLESDEFDVFLSVDLGQDNWMTNDDDEVGLATSSARYVSHLDIRGTPGGTVTIYVSSFAKGATGRYTLLLERPTAGPPGIS